jgi:hypothetical protein
MLLGAEESECQLHVTDKVLKFQNIIQFDELKRCLYAPRYRRQGEFGRSTQELNIFLHDIFQLSRI